MAKKTGEPFGNPVTRPKVERRLPLTDKQKNLMVATLIRDEATFRSIRSRIDSHRHFRNADLLYGAIWSTADEFYEKHERLPTAHEMAAELSNQLQDDRYADLDDRDIGQMQLVLKKARLLKQEEITGSRTLVRGYLQQFLEERLHEAVRKQVDDDDTTPRMFPLLDTYMQEAQSIKSIETGEIGELFSTTDDEDGDEGITLDKRSTGCTFLDFYMGGQAAGEVYGLLAPYGVCKTTLAVQLAVHRMKEDQMFWYEKKRSYDLPRIYMVFYEEQMPSVKTRLLSCAGTIHRTSMEGKNWKAGLSRKSAKNYKPYEQKMFADAIQQKVAMNGELERLNIAKRQINRSIRVIDFTGTRADYRDNAADMVAGIAAVIEQDQANCNNPGVSLVIVDYAGAAADRHCEAKSLDPARMMRHLIGRFPLRLSNNVAIKFQCPVWVMHQLNTEANSRAAGAVPKATDASEAKNFAENLAFAFMVGTKTMDNLAVLTNTKQRRAEKKHDTVIKIDGALSRVLDTGNMYRIDNSKIISARDFDRFADGDSVTEDTDSVFESTLNDVGIGSEAMDLD